MRRFLPFLVMLTMIRLTMVIPLDPENPEQYVIADQIVGWQRSAKTSQFEKYAGTYILTRDNQKYFVRETPDQIAALIRAEQRRMIEQQAR